MAHIPRCIVVCRTQEDIRWVHDVWSSALVYNKGLPVDLPRIPVVQQPREGSEALSIVQYILDHYDDNALPQVSVFVHGNLLDHLPLHQAQGYPVTPIEFLERLVAEAHQHGVSQNMVPSTHSTVEPTYRLPLLRSAFSYTGMVFGEWFSRVLGCPFPTGSPFLQYPSRCFAVRKDRILQHPKTYYQSLKKQLNVETSEFIHYLRASWFYVFSPTPKHSPLVTLPSRIGVILHGPTYADAFYEDGHLYHIRTQPCLQRAKECILDPLRARADTTVNVYLFTNPHAHVQEYATLLQADVVKTRDDITLAHSWDHARRFLPDLWTDHDFLIVLRADAFLLTPLPEWNLDPTKHNVDGGAHLLEAFSVTATAKHSLLPPHWTITPQSYPLYISHLRSRPLLAR